MNNFTLFKFSIDKNTTDIGLCQTGLAYFETLLKRNRLPGYQNHLNTIDIWIFISAHHTGRDLIHLLLSPAALFIFFPAAARAGCITPDFFCGPFYRVFFPGAPTVT